MSQQLRGDSATLPDGAVPVESRLLTFDEVEDHRRLWCRRQASCLDYAERNAWPSYSCTLCPVRDELTEEERKLSWLRMQAAIDEMHEAEESVE